MIFDRPDVIGKVDSTVGERFHKSLPYIDKRRDSAYTADISLWGVDVKRGDSQESRAFVDELTGILDESGVIARASLISVIAYRKMLGTGSFTVVPSWHRDSLRVVVSRGANTEFLAGDIPVVTAADDIVTTVNTAAFAELEAPFKYVPEDDEAVMFDMRHWHRSATNTGPEPVDRLFATAYVSLPAADKMISF